METHLAVGNAVCHKCLFFSFSKSVFICVSFCGPVSSVCCLHNFTHEPDQTVNLLSFLLISFGWYHPWQGSLWKASPGIRGGRMWSMSMQHLAPSVNHIGKARPDNDHSLLVITKLHLLPPQDFYKDFSQNKIATSVCKINGNEIQNHRKTWVGRNPWKCLV